ncbi:iron complex transport system substrate-binding protein [Cytobacillus oceanisediminis]|jgi:iron complex transport system substrate-binding protein|uniref:Iron complex transport system substrate-binding protein n=1 Tax=Cytobacillus oceanisediminis TaxID=665099 RepID=A0A2V3A1X2_9BACI|nr:cobalamin-binding protein [Cytobacillus oceanisediminis]PWW29702.1 iron complex transport system substrate-binding protein [Cytobacillus oceanisediminis]
MKILSLCPSNTELMEYLGFTHMLAGVDDYSDWPDQISGLPRLGPDLSINMDKVEELKPDLVLASLSVPGMEKNVEELKKRHIPHIVLNPQSLEDIEQDLITVSEKVGKPEAGISAAKGFRAKTEELKKISAGIKEKSSLYWEWWPKPVFTPGKINWLTEISEIAGAKNLFSDVELASVQTDWDDVLKRQPDYICLAWVGVRREKVNPEIVLKRPGWSELEAVKQNKILVLEEELYCRPSPRLIEGAVGLAKKIHPEAFSSL